MTKKSTPTAFIVPGPPHYLSERSKDLWLSIVGRRIKSPEEIILFEEGLCALDRCDQCRTAILKDGLMIEGENMAHVHPLLKTEKDARLTFSKIWKLLNLTFTPSWEFGKKRIKI